MVAEKNCAAQITWGDGMMMGCITVRLIVRWINGIRRIHAVMAKKPQSVLFMWQRGVTTTEFSWRTASGEWSRASSASPGSPR